MRERIVRKNHGMRAKQTRACDRGRLRVWLYFMPVHCAQTVPVGKDGELVVVGTWEGPDLEAPRQHRIHLRCILEQIDLQHHVTLDHQSSGQKVTMGLC